MSLQSLPNELFLEITSHLGLKDRHSLLFTNRRYSQIISKDILNFAVIWCENSLNTLQIDTLHMHSNEVTAAACAYGLTALHLGAINGNINAVKFILEKTISIRVTVADGEILRTPIPKDKLESTSEFLVKAGAASKVDCALCGNTALHYAAENGHEAMVKRLLDHGVVDRENPTGHRALHRAAAKGHENVVRQLAFNGGSEKDCAHSGSSALHYAARNNRMNIVKILLEEFHWDINAQGCNLRTALHIAADNGDRKLAKYLLQRGADNNLQDADFLIAAEVAYDVQDDRDADSTKMVKLIESFSINTQCLEGETPLHRAARNGSLVMVKRLLGAGVEMNVQDKKGYTPLHLAAKSDGDIVFELLNRGADASLKDSRGLRAIDIAGAASDKIYGVFIALGHE